jgi:hypothetical protein
VTAKEIAAGTEAVFDELLMIREKVDEREKKD